MDDLLQSALDCRLDLLDPQHQSALRLFNGFSEGLPALAIDLYAATLLIHNLADPPASLEAHISHISDFYLLRLPWLKAVLLKTRHAASRGERNGRLLYGTAPADRVREHGVWYALDLTSGQDASLYLDTRLLRKWALDHLQGRSVLNTFAYTGSLGVAALAGGASRVVQLDRSNASLELARTSCRLNGFPIHEADYLVGDFFARVSALKRTGAQFDCVLLDPPYISSGSRTGLNLEQDSPRLVNKLRPLVKDGGWLVAVNNALFLSGNAYLASLQALCVDGFLEVEALIPVPEDFTGFSATRRGEPPLDPAPFNHPTKIALLRVRKKPE